MIIRSQPCVLKVLMCNGVLTLLINKTNFIAVVCLLCRAYSWGSVWGGVAMVTHGAVFGGGIAMVTHGVVVGLSWWLSGVVIRQ